MSKSYINCTKEAALLPGEMGPASTHVKPAVPANGGSHEVIFTRTEVTDKGSLNQRKVLERRAALVEEMYAPESSPRIFRIHGA
jgi:hypothetical protein